MRHLPKLAAVLAAVSVLLTALPGATAERKGDEYADPYDLVYSVQHEGGRIVKATTTTLSPEASRIERVPTKPRSDERVGRDHGTIQPQLATVIAGGGDRTIEVVITYEDDLQLPRFPVPQLGEGRQSPLTQAMLREAQQLSEQVAAARAEGYRTKTQLINELGGKVLDTYWLIDGVHAAVPPEAVNRLAESPEVLYIELAHDVARPPHHDGNTANDPVKARAAIRSDPYFNLGQTSGWIGLLDTGVRTTHTMFNSPNNLAITSDLTGDGDPTDQCNHGTASAGLLTGNANIGTDWRGVSAISVDSWDIYGNNCLVGAAHTVSGFQSAVLWLNKVIVAEVQLNSSDTSAASTAADNAFDTGSVIIAANGNFGPNASTVRSPANARKAIGIGAYDLAGGGLMNYSGRGPTSDGRIKPDLTFPTNTETSRSASNTAMGSFGGTSAATPVAGGAAGLLRNWMRHGVGSIDPGHVHSHLILGGQDTWPFGNDEGAGRFRLGTGGHAWWGKVSVGQGQVTDIPIPVTAGKTLFEGALWWPETSPTHNDIDLRLVAPNGTVHAWSLSGPSVFERASVTSGVTTGTWKLRITGYSVTGNQTVYWSARSR